MRPEPLPITTEESQGGSVAPRDPEEEYFTIRGARILTTEPQAHTTGTSAAAVLTLRQLITFYEALQQRAVEVGIMIDRLVEKGFRHTHNFFADLELIPENVSGPLPPGIDILCETVWNILNCGIPEDVFTTTRRVSAIGDYHSDRVQENFNHWSIKLRQRHLSAFLTFIYLPPYSYGMDDELQAREGRKENGFCNTMQAAMMALDTVARSLNAEGGNPFPLGVEIILRLCTFFVTLSQSVIQLHPILKSSIETLMKTEGVLKEAQRLDHSYALATALAYIEEKLTRSEILDSAVSTSIDFGAMTECMVHLLEKVVEFNRVTPLSSWFSHALFHTLDPLAFLFEERMISEGVPTPSSVAVKPHLIVRLQALLPSGVTFSLENWQTFFQHVASQVLLDYKRVPNLDAPMDRMVLGIDYINFAAFEREMTDFKQATSSLAAIKAMQDLAIMRHGVIKNFLQNGGHLLKGWQTSAYALIQQYVSPKEAPSTLLGEYLRDFRLMTQLHVLLDALQLPSTVKQIKDHILGILEETQLCLAMLEERVSSLSSDSYNKVLYTTLWGDCRSLLGELGHASTWTTEDCLVTYIRVNATYTSVKALPESLSLPEQPHAAPSSSRTSSSSGSSSSEGDDDDDDYSAPPPPPPLEQAAERAPNPHDVASASPLVAGPEPVRVSSPHHDDASASPPAEVPEPVVIASPADLQSSFEACCANFALLTQMEEIYRNLQAQGIVLNATTAGTMLRSSSSMSFSIPASSPHAKSSSTQTVVATVRRSSLMRLPIPADASHAESSSTQTVVAMVRSSSPIRASIPSCPPGGEPSSAQREEPFSPVAASANAADDHAAGSVAAYQPPLSTPLPPPAAPAPL